MRRIDYIGDCERIQAKLRMARWDLTLSECEDFWNWRSEQDHAGWLNLNDHDMELARLRERFEEYLDECCVQNRRTGDWRVKKPPLRKLLRKLAREAPHWLAWNLWSKWIWRWRTRNLTPEQRIQLTFRRIYVPALKGLLNSQRTLSCLDKPGKIKRTGRGGYIKLNRGSHEID